MAVAVYSHPSCALHDAGPGHPEAPGRIAAVLDAMTALPGVEVQTAVPATVDALRAVHTPAHLQLLADAHAAGGRRLDPDTVMSTHSWDAMFGATGAVLAGVERAHSGVSHAFAAVRPPGHHALADRAMGFCLVNNVAVTAAYLRDRGDSVLVIDWDAHHGNGTQAMFDADADVFYVSMHEWPLYPGTGRIDEIGSGPGAGSTLNFPFPAGTTGDAYLDAIDNVVEPIAEQIRPDWVLISAGFDAHRDDPLTDLGLAAGDYADLTARVVSLAPARRVIAFLEGGYDLDALQASVAATSSALVGGNLRPESATAGGPGRAVVSAVRELRGSDPSRN